MGRESSSRPEGRCAPGDRGARQPEACVGCSRSGSRRVEGTGPPRIWPGARAYRSSRAAALGLAFGRDRRGEWWRGCVRQQRRGLKLLRLRRFGCFGPPKGCWERTQIGEFGVHRSILRKLNIENAAFGFPVNSEAIASTDCGILDAIVPSCSRKLGARFVWSGGTSFR